MIKINLLPHELRPITRTPLPHIASLLILGVALVFMFQIFMRLNTELNSVNRQVEAQQKALDALDNTLEENKILQEQKVILQARVAAIQGILKGRTIWSEHIYRLTALTPENIWYKRIYITTSSHTVEKFEPDPKTGKSQITRETQNRPVLKVEGYAIDDGTGESTTATFGNNTEADPDFSSKFQLWEGRTMDTEFDDFPVKEFLFEYVIN